MKLSISNIGWSRAEDNSILTILKNYGFRGLEIAPARIWDDPYNQTKAKINTFKTQLQNYDLQISSLQALLFGIEGVALFESTEGRLKLLKVLQKAIQLASNLEAETIIFGSPKNRLVGSLHPDEYFPIAFEFFDALGTRAHELGTSFCIEPNPKVYGADFITTTLEAKEFVEKINNPGLHINIDIGTMILNKEPITETVLDSAAHTRHLHVSEPFLAAIQDDSDRHRQIAKTLKKCNYANWVSIEIKAETNKSNVESVLSALEIVRTYYAI
jgi:D-psicose/D-tagatose/L-ribulose 3-epimerase